MSAFVSVAPSGGPVCPAPPNNFPAAWLIVLPPLSPTGRTILGSNKVYTSRRRAEAAARMLYANTTNITFVKVGPCDAVPF